MSTEPNVMLAPNEAIEALDERIKWPVLGSGKLDGMRVKVMPDGLYSRNHKKLASEYHALFVPLLREVKRQDVVLDGELWSPTLKFNEIMRKENVNKLQFHCFDMMTRMEWYEGTEQPFMDRVEHYQQWVKRFQKRHPIHSVYAIDQVLLRTPADVTQLVKQCLAAGHEGAMIRHIMSKYKHGRATLLEALIYKFKEWVTIDGRITGFKQATAMKKEVQTGERTRDAMGQMERSHKKSTRDLVDFIGSIEVEYAPGKRCYVTEGAGSPLKQAGCNWKTRERFIGKWVEFKFQAHGTHEKPRFGSIVRMRPDRDNDSTILEPNISILEAFTPPHKGDIRKVRTI